MITTTVFEKTIEAYNKGYRIVVNKGGTRSGKTVSELQLAYFILEKKTNPYLISVVSETMPHIRKGALNDFRTYSIPEIYNEKDWMERDMTYFVKPKQRLEFFSADVPDKVHGPGRDGLILNEVQNMKLETVRQLMQRTADFIFMDYNPTHSFWIDEKILIRPDCFLIHSTYLDNEMLPKGIKQEIEANKDDENWWRVYGLGETGSREGLIYPSINLVDEIPSNADISYGLDFGYNHSCVLMKVGLYNNELWWDEIIHEKGLLTSDIIRKIKERNIKQMIYADNARPDLIEEIFRAGINIKGCDKKDKLQQIMFIKKHKINVTKNSINTIKEFRDYRWVVDKNGKPTDETIRINDDAMDGGRYGIIGKWYTPQTTYKPHVQKMW